MAEKVIGEYKTVYGMQEIVLSGDYAAWMIENNPELRNDLVKSFRKVFDDEFERVKRTGCI